MADSGRIFAAYGPLASVELWNTHARTLQRTIQTGQGAISQVAFVGPDDDLITAGRDGRLTYWDSSGGERVLAKLDAGISTFAITPDRTRVVLSTTNDTLWRITDGKLITQLLGRHPITQLRRAGNTSNVGVIYKNGDLSILDMISWRQTLIFHSLHAIRDIAFTADGSTLSIVDNDGIISVAHQSNNDWSRPLRWTSFSMHATRVALTNGGIVVVLCNNGTTWIYAEISHHWTCIPVSVADLTMIAINSEGTSAAVLDSDGHIIWIDLTPASQSHN